MDADIRVATIGLEFFLTGKICCLIKHMPVYLPSSTLAGMKICPHQGIFVGKLIVV